MQYPASSSRPRPQGALVALAVVGALLAWAGSRLTHEHFNAVALLVAALCVYYLGARFYSGFIASRVVHLDDANTTPAHRLRDGHDYMPFRRWTLFGMHFAWIAGPGPLIGPTLAAQFGFLPGFLWIVLGAVLIGCVQDFIILVFSTRRDGMSLARMLRKEINPLAGVVGALAVIVILEILMGVLALVVVNALKGSAWGAFTIFASIPIAFLVGWYMTKLRPGHEGQATAVGVALLIAATALGHYVPHIGWLNAIFNRTDAELAVAIVVYGFCAAALPAWMLLAPRDNISTYLKIGTVALLALGIIGGGIVPYAQLTVHMPAVTSFASGDGPIFGGGVFPFCFIIIACGAISGFHSLISSGPTPRLVDKESDMRTVGYGAMLTESFVGVMALIAAVTLVPGVYLAMNMPPPKGAPGKGTLPPAMARAFTQKISDFGPTFAVTPSDMDAWAKRVQEPSLYSRTGGGPSLAVGMANIFAKPFERLGGGLTAFWYHFAIMFEAVFILTVLDSGTRVIRFIFHEILHDVSAMRAGYGSTPPAPLRKGGELDAAAALLRTGGELDAAAAPLRKGGELDAATADSPLTKGGRGGHIPVWLTSGLAVVGWGFILWWGIVDKQGGVKALLKMFGTSNQLLAVIALALATVIMVKKHRRYAWVTALPGIVVAVITLTASWETIFSADPRVGAIASAHLPTATAVDISNAYLSASLTGLLALCTLTVIAIAVWESALVLRRPALPDEAVTEAPAPATPVGGG